MRHTRLGLSLLGVAGATLALTASIGPPVADDHAAPAAAASAATLGYLRIEGIQGSVTAQGYEGWIEVTGLEWGISNPSAATTGSRTMGQSEFNPVVVVKPVDKATPILAQACAAGRHYRDAQLVFFAAGSTTPNGSVGLSDITISEAFVSGGDAAVPTETLALSFGRIEWSFIDIDPATGRPRGEVKAGWDLVANRAM